MAASSPVQQTVSTKLYLSVDRFIIVVVKTEETFNCNAFFPGLLVVPVKTDLSVKRQFVVTTRDHADLALFVNFNASITRHQCLKAERRRRNRIRRKRNRIKQIKEMIDYRLREEEETSRRKRNRIKQIKEMIDYRAEYSRSFTSTRSPGGWNWPYNMH